MHASTRIAAAVLSLVGAMTAGSALAGGAEQTAGDCFAPGFKAGDADAVAACYAEDAVIWFPGGPMARGRAAIRDGFAQYFASVTVKEIQMTAMGQERVGKTRVSWGTYAIRAVDKTTQVETLQRGRYTDVQKKIGGRWLYTVDHPSDDPAPAAP